MAIANPCQTELMNAIYTTDMLLNKENAALRYIEHMTASTEAVETKQNTVSTEELLKKAVLRGNESGIVEITRKLLFSVQQQSLTKMELLFLTLTG